MLEACIHEAAATTSCETERETRNRNQSSSVVCAEKQGVIGKTNKATQYSAICFFGRLC
jgi:hypothetical protein